MQCPHCKIGIEQRSSFDRCSSCNKEVLKHKGELLPAFSRQHGTSKWYFVVMLRKCDLVGVGKTLKSAAADLVRQMSKYENGGFPHTPIVRHPRDEPVPLDTIVLEYWKTPLFCRFFLRLYEKQRMRWGKGKKERYFAHSQGIDHVESRNFKVMWRERR